MPVLLHSICVSASSYKQYSGLVRFAWPVIVALNVVQVLLFICTVLFTDGVGAVLLKQIELVVSAQEIALMQ